MIKMWTRDVTDDQAFVFYPVGTAGGTVVIEEVPSLSKSV